MQRMPSMPNIPKPNPLHTTFKNPNFPANFINEHNVLDYFCNPDNIFYDTKSCNQVIRMQQIDRPLEECLAAMPGDQYILHSARPPLFVILKQTRSLQGNQNIVTPLVYYYVINGTVYQAPDAFSLIQSRLLGAVAPLGKAFEQMLKFSRFNVAKGYSWEFATKPAGEGGDEEKEDEEDEEFNAPSTSAAPKKKTTDDEAAYAVARSSAFQEQRTTNILHLLFDQFPPPSGVAPKPGSGEAGAAAAASAAGAAADQAAASAAAAAANPLGGIAAMLPPGDDGKDDQPPTKRGK